MIQRLRRLPWKLTHYWAAAAASWLRRQWVRLTHMHATVRFEGPVSIGPRFDLLIPDDATLIVGPGVQFRRGFHCEIGPGGRVVIGRECVFTHDVVIQCSTTIEIGDRCQFGQASIVVDGNHRFRDPDRPMLEQGYDFRPIRIEDDVAVTTKCTVMASIGRHSFVGANSVVSRDIPPYSLALGAPARAIDRYPPAGYDPAGEIGEPAASAQEEGAARS